MRSVFSDSRGKLATKVNQQTTITITWQYYNNLLYCYSIVVRIQNEVNITVIVAKYSTNKDKEQNKCVSCTINTHYTYSPAQFCMTLHVIWYEKLHNVEIKARVRHCSLISLNWFDLILQHVDFECALQILSLIHFQISEAADSSDNSWMRNCFLFS